MKITQESTGELTATIKIEISPVDYNEQVNKILKDYQRKANIPGFRPGKVPFGMVKKMYGSSVFADELNKLLSETLNNYITENKIEILGQPLANDERTPEFDGDENKDLEFYFDLGLMPEFTLEFSDKTAVDYYKISIDETMVDNYVADISRRNGKMINPEVSAPGDSLKGEFAELDADGNIVADGHSCTNALSTDQILDENEKARFSGLKTGDSIVFNPAKAVANETNLATLLDVDKETAAHMQSDFRFTVQEISRMDPAPVDQVLFDLVYPESGMTTTEEFREKIRQEAAVAFEADTDKLFVNNAVKKLIQDSNITLPDAFMKRWLLDNNQGKLTPEAIDAEYERFAESMRWQLIENKIIRDHNLVVTDAEIKNFIKGYFKPGNTQEEIDPETEKRFDTIADTIMKNKEEVHKINDKLYEQKLNTLMKSTLKLVEKEISYEEFINLASANQ
jgi:trigger factor